MSSLGPRKRSSGKTIAVGGGKGGVGKTLFAVNLAVVLSRMRKKVSLFDGDLGNSNCNTLLGITRVHNTLEEYLRKECSFSEIVVPTTYPGLHLICGAQNRVDSLLPDEMPRLLIDLRRVKADCLVLDLGAGVTEETLDLYRMAEEKIVVVTPQVTSLQNAYGFVKSAFLHDLQRTGNLAKLLDQTGSDVLKLHSLIDSMEPRGPDRRAFAAVLARQSFQIVGNMVEDDKDLKIIQNLQKVIGQYLCIENKVLGAIRTSEDIRDSINRITPFVALSPDSLPSREMNRMAARIYSTDPGKD